MNSKADQLYRLATSFPAFVKAIGALNGFETPALHLAMAEALTAGHDFVGLNGFRGSGKSYVTGLYCSWRLWLDPHLQVIVACGERLRANQFNGFVVGTLFETPWLKHLAPKVDRTRIGEKWYCSGIKRGDWPSFTARTTRGNFRGPRASLIVLDDPIASQFKDALGFRTALLENLQDVPRILHPAGQSFKAHGLDAPQYARTRCVGLWTPTSPAPGNFYGKASEKEHFFNRFEVYRFPAILEPEHDTEGLLVAGRSAWPEKFSFDYLQAEQHANPYGFRLEFQADDTPVQDERSLIRVDKLKTERATPSNLVCLVDPAGGGGDEFAYAIGGLVRDADGTRLHVKKVGGWANQLPDESVRMLLDLLHEIGCKRVVNEENYPAAATLRNAANARKMPLVIDSFKSTIKTGSKEDRLKMRLPSYLHAAAVTFDPSVLEDGKTTAQMALLRSTPGLPSKCDRLDALEMLCSQFANQIRRSPQKQGDKPKGRVRFA